MINFPDTPTLAQIFTTAGSSWQWDGNKWEGATVASGSPYLPLTGGTLTGALNINAAGAGPSLTIKTKGVVIGNTAPDPGLGGLILNANAAAGAPVAGQQFAMAAADNASALFFISTFGTGATSALALTHARGTGAAPTAIQSGDYFGSFSAQGYAASGYSTFGFSGLRYSATENWTASAQGSKAEFLTVPTGATAPVVSLTLQGNTASFSGNVGIGTTAPGGKLHVGGNATSGGVEGTGSTVIFGAPDDGYASVVIQRAGVANPQVLDFGVNQASLYSEIQSARNGINVGPLLLNRQGGNVGIGTAVPGSLLTVNGTCANVSGAWTTISDASVKQDVQPYTRGLEAIVALKPVQFRYAKGTPFAEPDKPSRVLFGLIADDVKPHVPEVVGTTTATIGKKEGVELSTLEPGNLIYALINAVKELNAKVVAMSPPPARRKAA